MGSGSAMDDIDYSVREALAVRAFTDAVPPEYKIGEGVFCKVVDHRKLPLKLAVTVDGVGTKTAVATMMRKYDTIGIDLVAMNQNDLDADPGNGNVEPFLFLDYLSLQADIESNEKIMSDLGRGVAEGLRRADASDVMRTYVRPSMIAGETASEDEVVTGPRRGYGFGMAAAMIGLLEKNRYGIKIPEVGDVIVGFRSSGVHCNELTACRTKLLKPFYEPRPDFRGRYTGRYELGDKIPGTDTTIGEALLTPTLIYSKSLVEIAEELFTEHNTGFVGVHITGYGIKNINRVGKFVRYCIDEPLQRQPIFDLVQEESGFSEEEMERKFNRDMGFAVIVNPSYVDLVITKAKLYGFDARYVGRVIENASEVPSVVVNRRGGSVSFQGYQ